MKEEKAKTISLSTFFLILAIIIIAIMGLFIYNLNNDKTTETKKSAELQTKANNLNNNINELQEKINSISNTISSVNTAANSNKNETIENNANTNKKIDENQIYKSIIDNYKKAFSEYDENDENSLDTLEKKYSNINSFILFVGGHTNMKVLYSLYDIDKNGTNELIISTEYENYKKIGAIYSYNKDTNKAVKVYYPGTIERGDFSIYDNGIMIELGTGGAYSHGYDIGKISQDGLSFELIDQIDEEYIEETKTRIYTDIRTQEVLNYKSEDDILNKYVPNSKKVNFDNYYEIK